MKVVGSGSVVRRDRKLDGTLKDRKRCRVWDVSVVLDDGTHPSMRVEGTESDARAKLAAWIARIEATVDDSTTFAEYAWAWHRRRAESGMYAARTMDGEVYRINALCTHLGKMRLVDIGRRDVEDCYTRLMRGETPSGRPYSPKSIECAHKTLSAILHDAVSRDILPSAPTSHARRPKVPPAVRRVPTSEEVDAMVASLDLDDPHHMAVALCACCGLRRSEAVRVLSDWSCFDGSRLHVASSSDEDGGAKPTKTTAAREVPVPRPLAARLNAMELEEWAIRPKVLTRWWSRNRASLGMDGVRLHDLRHAYATRLAEAGVHPRVMMQLGGWESIDVCMEIYTHVNSSALDDAVDSAFA